MGLQCSAVLAVIVTVALAARSRRLILCDKPEETPALIDRYGSALPHGLSLLVRYINDFSLNGKMRNPLQGFTFLT